MITIAIDLMGSDLGYEELSKSVIQYLNEEKDRRVILFGDQEKIKPLFASIDSSRYEIVHCEDVIPMEIKPLDFLRSKKASLYKAIDAVRNGKADAILTAGSTGGFVTGCSMLLKNIEGVTRSGLCTPFPTAKEGKGTVILDVGASNVNQSEDIYGFARMGRIYCQNVLDMENPSTFVLSNGTEEGKGTDEIIGAYKLLKDNNFPNFQGNAEARNVLDGNHDLIVTGGFCGNIFLKATEGMASIMNGLIKQSFKRSLLTKIGYLFSHKGFDKMKEIMDYRRFGGAILLGVNGVAIKAHGNSNTYAFYMAIKVADQMVKSDIVNKIKKEFEHQDEKQAD
ncbi:MAG: phosphate acyltransferase PlsX [Bacilli bacterium]